MTRLTLCLVSVTASLGLAAEPAPQEKSKFWPWEAQIGASFMGYNSKKISGHEFSPDNPRLAPSIRFSLDPISLPFGSILFSAGYRLENELGLDAWSDLKHEGQLQVGALLRFETSKNFDFEAGFDYRNDSMLAPERRGTESKHSEWRPWLRANARYLFDRGTNVTPFVGIEGAFALSSMDVSASDYIRDYANNTGRFPGQEGPRTEQSYTKGHFPLWEVALVGGVRFGRHGGYSASPKPSKPKEVAPVATETPVTRTEETRRPTRPNAQEEARRAEEEARQAEARRRAEEERQAEEARRRADEARREEERRQAEEATRRQAEATRRQAEADLARARAQVEAVILYFPTSGDTETSQDRALIKTWATQYKNIVDPSDLIITGHTDNQGTWDRNKDLSVRRANRMASLLRAEGITVPAANITGESFDKPVADNDTAEGRAKNRRVELRIKGVNTNSVREGRLAGVR